MRNLTRIAACSSGRGPCLLYGYRALENGAAKFIHNSHEGRSAQISALSQFFNKYLRMASRGFETQKVPAQFVRIQLRTGKDVKEIAHGAPLYVARQHASSEDSVSWINTRPCHGVTVRGD